MLKPNDKETEYMKMKIINSYQISSKSWEIITDPGIDGEEPLKDKRCT